MVGVLGVLGGMDVVGVVGVGCVGGATCAATTGCHNKPHNKTAPRGQCTNSLMINIVSTSASALNHPWCKGSAGVRLVLAGCLAVSLSGCAWLGNKQSELALRPTPTLPAHVASGEASLRPGDLRFTVPIEPRRAVALVGPVVRGDATPQQLALWWLPHPDPQAPTLLYLHGTFRNLYQNLTKIDALREAGFAIVAVDYRGWGDSTRIVPTEASINADVQLAWAELQRRQPVPGRRVIFGHSMGGALAVSLASRLKHGNDYGALVLESTFTRLPDVAATAGFWGRVAAGLTTLQFNSLGLIGRVDAPILMLHGDADRTVPISLGRRLRDAAPPGVRWLEVPGGTHSQLHSQAPAVYRQALIDLMKAAAAPLPGE